MGNNNAIVTSTCSNIFVVTFNQSDILYWLYRDLYEVIQNRPIMVSGIMAAGSVKVGVIYYKNNEMCTYDLFRVGHGAVLTIKSVSQKGVDEYSIDPIGKGEKLEEGLRIKVRAPITISLPTVPNTLAHRRRDCDDED